jgi:hypothetical protein
MSVDVGRFASAEDEVAVRIRREDLPGLFRKRLELPAGLVALVRHDGAAASVVTGPASVDTLTDALLVKAARLRIEVACDAGRSHDDLPVQASLGLDLEARRTAIDLHQLERALVGERGRAGRAELRAYFEPFVRDAVRLFVAARTADALATTDQRPALEDHLREQLKKPLFEAGCSLGDVVHPTFKSEALDARRQQAAEARAKADALTREKELVELRKGIDRHALLADIEIKDEADRARKEKRLAQFEALRARMGDDDRKALVMMLDDDAQRARLIREIIDKDLSPEQRASAQLGDMEARVAGRLAELQQKLAQLSGGGLQANGHDPITRRILCVVGKRVLAFDPKTNLHPEVPKEVHDTEGGTLGYLRSVRTERIDAQDQVLAGAQRGVYRLAADGKRFEYAFPREPEGKGGANAVAYFDGRVYATHSEMGLCEWPVGGGPGRFICDEVTRGQTATRGALVVDGRLYFSTGNDVLSLDLAAGGDRPARFKGSDDSVTAFVVQGDEVVAGNRNGKLYRWRTDDPGSAEAFNVLKKNPIYMLRHARIAGQGFYIIGSKDFTITAAEPRRDVYREYQTREEVRWVDGAADFIVGVTRSGYKVLVWDAHHQTEPKLTIRVSDKVQDLFVQRALPAGAQGSL